MRLARKLYVCAPPRMCLLAVQPEIGGPPVPRPITALVGPTRALTPRGQRVLLFLSSYSIEDIPTVFDSCNYSDKL